MKNSRVWKATDTSAKTPKKKRLGRLISPDAREALKLAREFWPRAGSIKVELVKR